MKMTVEKMGDFDGDEDAYVNAYTLALRVNPMDFAKGVVKSTEMMKNLIFSVTEKAKNAGQTILFAGADSYLYMLPKIFYDLKDKRIAVAVYSEEWKEKLSYLFPRGRIMLFDEFTEDKETYEYIFDIEKDDLFHLEELQNRLSEEAVIDAFVPQEMIMSQDGRTRDVETRLAEKKTITEYYNASIDGTEFAFLQIKNKLSEKISFGEISLLTRSVQKFEALSVESDIFIEARDWNYDMYRYNGSVALQTLLSANVVNMEHTIASEYIMPEKEKISQIKYRLIPEDAIAEDVGLRTDLIEESERAETAVAVQNGDLLLFSDGEKMHTAVVNVPGDNIYASGEMIVIRPQGMYTAEYLQLYLEGPVGNLFLKTMRAGKILILQKTRLMRIPLPVSEEERISVITETGKNVMSKLSSAAEEWRKAKRESVQLMMGK